MAVEASTVSKLDTVYGALEAAANAEDDAGQGRSLRATLQRYLGCQVSTAGGGSAGAGGGSSGGGGSDSGCDGGGSGGGGGGGSGVGGDGGGGGGGDGGGNGSAGDNGQGGDGGSVGGVDGGGGGGGGSGGGGDGDGDGDGGGDGDTHTGSDDDAGDDVVECAISSVISRSEPRTLRADIRELLTHRSGGKAGGGGAMSARAVARVLHGLGSPQYPAGEWQGLTLVHFSAQLEPYLTHKKYPRHPKHPLTPP